MSDAKSVFEKFMLTSKHWSEGYHFYTKLFGKPLGWLYVFQDSTQYRLLRLNQKGNCTFFAKSDTNALGCMNFLGKYFEQLKEDSEKQRELPFVYKCAYGRDGAVFGVYHADQLKGFLVLCSIARNTKELSKYMKLFSQFLQSQAELAYKNYELQNFYETVHPRALALSTMHSVNRIICSSLHLEQLLPQIGRLFAQVLKANDCSIYFVDSEQKYLIPRFVMQNRKAIERKSRIRIGAGIEGKVAESSEFFLSKKCIAIPFVGEEVIGVVSLENKLDRQEFTVMDLEILKTLSEQAVVAIKNAKLYDETEQLTHGSIQAINDLLELGFGNVNIRLPLFSELVFEIGKAMQLSSIEITSLYRASFLIDTGHLATPAHIRTKKSSLTKLEFEQIKKHPRVGASVLRKMGVLEPVIPIVTHHHERYDGKGYPDGLKGTEIPLGARIASVADAFTSMLLVKPYRRKKSIEEAFDEIKQHAGSQFDPQVVDVFLKVIRLPDISKKIERLAEGAGEPVSRSRAMVR